MSYLIDLKDATTELDLAQVGGKARSLAQLLQAGFPVPSGIVLKSVALFDLLQGDRLMAETAVSVGAETPTQALFVESEAIAAVQAELETAIARLCPQGERVAVRSSALAEDGTQHSFAGQMESVLQVEPAAAWSQVLRVWRSAYAARCQAYQQSHQLAAAPLPPAVLIQPMIAAEVAGIAFAADPVSGRRGVVVITAVRGLADRLAAGEVTGDRYDVDRLGTVIDRQTGELPVLTEAQIQAIAQLTRAVSRQVGQPQDIEWAWADGQLWLLQARPITTLMQMPDPDARFCLWDNSNIVESFNGITTPLTFSFARKAYDAVYRQFCRFMGVPATTIEQNQSIFRCMIGCIQGRIYYNLLSWYRLLALLPGSRTNARFMESMMGVRETLPESVVLELKQQLQSNRVQTYWRSLTTLVGMIVNFLTLPSRIQRYHQRIDRALRLEPTPTRPENLQDWRADELATHYRTLEQDLLGHWDAPLITDFFAMIFYGLLRRLVQDWSEDDAATLHHDLIGGEGGVISTEPLQRMRDMAQCVSDRPDATAVIAQFRQGDLPTILEWIAQNPPFAAKYAAYLEKFGDRCLEELKLESPTLHEDPLPLLRSVGHLAHQYQSGSVPDTTLSQQHRQHAEHRMHTVLADHPLRRLIFNLVLHQARIHVRNRENLRFERTRVFGRARRVLLELGQRLHQGDRLNHPKDVFYLEVEEVLGFVEGTLTCTDLRGLAALRQADYQRYRHQPAPAQRFSTFGMVYHGNTFQGKAATDAEPGENGRSPHQRQGVGCAPGQAQGMVRVMTASRADLSHPETTFPKGCILVAESTDPGWILLFPHVAGLLVERGSVLSHVAIVARELGIPMITSLPGITQWLQDGDLVEFDSGTGRIQKLESGCGN